MAKYEVKYQTRHRNSNSWSSSTITLELPYPDTTMAENSIKARLGSSVEEVRILNMKERK